MAQDGKPPATILYKIKKNAAKTAARQQPSGAGWTFRTNFGLHLPTPGAHLRPPPRGRDPALARGPSASEGSAEAVPTARWWSHAGMSFPAPRWAPPIALEWRRAEARSQCRIKRSILVLIL